MTSVSVAELHESLDRYLEQVKGGDEVVVTQDGNAVARLVPVAQPTTLERGSPRRRSYEELVAAGILRPPKRRLPPEFWTEPRVPDPEGNVLRNLLEEREHGR